MREVLGEAIVQITADRSGAEAELEALKGRLDALGASFEEVGRRLQGTGQQLQGLGKQIALGLGAPLAALGAASLKAAIDFESAFAGVRKTVDGTEEQMAALREGIRALSAELPATTGRIAAVAEAAGQLGIQTENILGFTRVMIDLGETTDLSAERGAVALARLANITQLPQDQFDRLGSVVVDLGNNLAATESEIVEFGLRIAGAGRQVGLSEAEILAFGAALASVGIRAEAGGTAISRVMVEISAAVDAGGERLAQFAQIAGMSAEQFRTRFQQDAAGAILAFIQGLGQMQAAGLSVFPVLDQLGLAEIRVRDALLRAAGATETFSAALRIGTTAWQENTALATEASHRYATTASQMQLLFNRVTLLRQEVGQAMVPALLALVSAAEPLLQRLASLAQWFAGLDERTRVWIVAVGAAVAAIGPLVVILGTVLSTVGAVVAALGPLSAAFSGLVGVVGAAVGALGTLSPQATLVIAAVTALTAAWQAWGADVVRITQGAVAGIVAQFQALSAQVQAAASAMLSALQARFQAGVAAIQASWQAWGADVVRITQGAASAVVAQFQALSARVQAVAAAMLSAVQARFQAGVAAIQAAWSGLASFFSSLWGRIQGIFQAAAGQISAVSQRIAGAVQRILSLIGRVRESAASVAGTVRGLVPGLQTGGRIVRPGLALVGERGPELVSLPRGAQVFPRGALPAPERPVVQLVQHLHVQATPADLQRYTERALRRIATEWGVL